MDIDACLVTENQGFYYCRCENFKFLFQLYSQCIMIKKVGNKSISGRMRMDIDTYLVIGNQKHYPFRDFIITPAEMMEIIETTGEI